MVSYNSWRQLSFKPTKFFTPTNVFVHMYLGLVPTNLCTTAWSISHRAHNMPKKHFLCRTEEKFSSSVLKSWSLIHAKAFPIKVFFSRTKGGAEKLKIVLEGKRGPLFRWQTAFPFSLYFYVAASKLLRFEKLKY
jgi:hypothetical protein